MRLYSHPSCLLHSAGAGHPESPARLDAVLRALADAGLDGIERCDAPQATREQLLRVHSAAHVAGLLDVPTTAPRRIDADTAINAHSVEAALRAAGAICAAIDNCIKATGDAQRSAFCAVRPPGHHATIDAAMGFCLFNSVAVGAAHALAVHGLQRVSIVDFDVHHGNGTQDIFWNEPRVQYLSSHQQAIYPGSGASSERGASGNIVNVGLPAGCASDGLRAAYAERMLPALDAFAPQLLLVSAGFDGHRLDPLAGLDFSTDDYRWLTEQLLQIAQRHAGGRIVSILEGGYSLTALRECSVAHVAVLLGTANGAD